MTEILSSVRSSSRGEPNRGLAIQAEQLSKQFVLPRPLGQMLRRPFPSGSGSAPDRRVVNAVDGVSLHVHEGELFGLLGPNGAGKTTLIKLLCTLIVPTSGWARVAGVDLSQEGRVRQLVGMASGDERSFYWRLTGRHNLEFFAALYGLDRRTARRRVDELLEIVDMTELADRPFRTYSSGQKQRLSIARALLHRPHVLFLDEPTRSLDPTATMKLHEFIEQELLGRQGMTIFLTTHRLDEAQRLCHRLAIMDGGRIKACGTPDELQAGLGPVITYRLKVRGLIGDPSNLVRGLPGQLSWQRSDGAADWLLELEAMDNEAALAALIERVTAAGGQVRDVAREKPSLERVFQRFTRPRDIRQR